MTAEDFAAWIDHMKLSERKVAETLQLSRTTVAKYRREGAPVHIGLACAALAFGLPEWRAVQTPND
jgi:transcriptional regulator with XRE-family HTH domain